MIKVSDVAYGRIRSPDLDAQEEFLTNFGMVRAERTRRRSTCGAPTPSTTPT